jgi:hypothetical protein
VGSISFDVLVVEGGCGSGGEERRKWVGRGIEGVYVDWEVSCPVCWRWSKVLSLTRGR